jgi:predicted DNA binding CopG/RHH family protein
MRPVQYFSDEYLEQSRKLNATEIARFLDDFQTMNSPNDDETVLISIRIPKSLLRAFRSRCELNQIAYQRKIKILMRDWLKS